VPEPGPAWRPGGLREFDFTAASLSWHHFVELAVFTDRLVLRSVSPDLRVADEAVIRS
jgi:hypothetical protein